MPPSPKPLVDLCKEEMWNRRRWDEPPALYFVYERHLKEMPLPPQFWGIGSPGDLLERIGNAALRPDGVEALAGAAALCGLLGFAFRYEGWMVIKEQSQVRPGVDPASATYDDFGGQPSQSPDRIEVRLMAAAVSTGQRILCAQRRDQGFQVEVAEGGVGNHAGQLGGRIPEALAKMTHAIILGSQQP